MNALPVKDRKFPSEIIDELIADYGFRKVALALVKRIMPRSRPPDARRAVPKVGVMSDHLRRDLGLPPEDKPLAYVDLSVWARRDLF